MQLVRDNRVVTRPVTLGLSVGTLTEVLTGIEDGDMVVAKSGSFLRDGDAVRPISKATKVSENRP